MLKTHSDTLGKKQTILNLISNEQKYTLLKGNNLFKISIPKIIFNDIYSKHNVKCKHN